MSRILLMIICAVSLTLSSTVFAKKDNESKGPNEMAYEKADEHSSFNREEESKPKKEKKEKKEKKGKK